MGGRCAGERRLLWHQRSRDIIMLLWLFTSLFRIFLLISVLLSLFPPLSMRSYALAYHELLQRGRGGGRMLIFQKLSTICPKLHPELYSVLLEQMWVFVAPRLLRFHVFVRFFMTEWQEIIIYFRPRHLLLLYQQWTVSLLIRVWRKEKKKKHFC